MQHKDKCGSAARKSRKDPDSVCLLISTSAFGRCSWGLRACAAEVQLSLHNQEQQVGSVVTRCLSIAPFKQLYGGFVWLADLLIDESTRGLTFKLIDC